MKRNFERGMIETGNFYDAFYSIQKELPSGAKQYICVQSKETKCDLDGQLVWPVHVAEVADVQPMLQLKSFYREGGRCKVKSRIVLKRGSEKHWFDVPVFQYDAQEIATRILENLS
jgi:hypothetical protein